MHRYAKGKFNNSNYLSENSLSFPTTNLTKKDQEYIIKKFLDEYENKNEKKIKDCWIWLTLQGNYRLCLSNGYKIEYIII